MSTEQLIVVFAVFAAGLVLGVIVTALLASRRRADALEQAALRFEVTRAQLTDRAGTAERELGEARAQLAAETARLDETRASVTELHGRAESLATALRMEREAATGKLAEIERAREQLTQAFSALSSEALKSNNQAFIDLAQQTLAKHQETAKGELERRQQAIDELVKPMRETLDKVDAKIQESRNRAPRVRGAEPAGAHACPRRRRSCAARPSKLVTGAAPPARPRPVGRDAAAARRGDGRHARPLRFLEQTSSSPTKAGCVPT